MDISQMTYMFNGHILGFKNERQKRRLERIRVVMKQQNVASLLLLGRGVDGICEWLTLLPGPDIPGHKNGGYIVNQEGSVIEFESNNVIDENFWKNYKEIDEMPIPTVAVEGVEKRKGLQASDIQLNGEMRLGVVHMSMMTLEQKRYLTNELKGIAFVDMTIPFLTLMSKKEDEEIEAMKVAANAHDRIFSMMNFSLRPGRLEREIVNEIRYFSYSMGGAGQDIAQTTVINLTSAPDGERSVQEPILFPGRRLQEGDRINLMLRAENYFDYYAGLGRCFVLGEASEETRKYWEIAVEAQHQAASVLKAGAYITDAEKKVNQFLDEHGIKEDQSAWIYGIGYSVGEVPVMNQETERVPLQEGMTLVIAPCIRLEEKDAFCCMDTYLITKNGCERLTVTSQKLIELKDR